MRTRCCYRRRPLARTAKEEREALLAVIESHEIALRRSIARRRPNPMFDSGLVDRLAARGLVERDEDATDRRIRRAKPTADGVPSVKREQA